MVAWGGLESDLRMFDPKGHSSINLVVIPHIDWNDLILGNDEFKRNSVFQVDRDAVQAV